HGQAQSTRPPQWSDLLGRQRGHGLAESDQPVHDAIAWRSSTARSRKAASEPPRSASPIRGEPTPTASAPAARYSRAAATSTPPVGTNGISGIGPARSRTYRGP